MMAALDLLAYLALLLAAWAAVRGGPAAAALVVSNIISRGGDLLGADFSIPTMVAFDLFVIAAIVIHSIRRRYIMLREVIILSLFLLAWRFYWVPDTLEHTLYVQYAVLSCVVICQLMLTLPWRTIIHRARLRLGLAVGRKPDRLERVAHA